MRIDVAIPTYRRPEGLARLLGGLQGLRFPAEAPELRVVVIDNDATGSARPVVEDARGWLDHPVVYAVEKRRGIAPARNAALALALDRADFVAFIDDDEVPEADWLAELLRVQRSWDADAVTGPVRPLFPAGTPAWIERGGFFAAPRRATGTRLDHAFTGNVLVRCSTLARLGSLFDERLALTGGEDVELFRRLADAGGRIVWADTAVAHQWVPPSRTNLRWLLARAFRVGCATAWIERHSEPRRRSAAWLFANACWCVAKGLLLLAAAAPGGRAAAVRAVRLSWDGAGRLAGLFGHVEEEYRTTHGG
jgi:succinoglycan biosynthesis protein ExoM